MSKPPDQLSLVLPDGRGETLPSATVSGMNGFAFPGTFGEVLAIWNKRLSRNKRRIEIRDDMLQALARQRRLYDGWCAYARRDREARHRFHDSHPIFRSMLEWEWYVCAFEQQLAAMEQEAGVTVRRINPREYFFWFISLNPLERIELCTAERDFRRRIRQQK